MTANRFAIWFGRVVWLGILANFALGIADVVPAGSDARHVFVALRLTDHVAQFRGPAVNSCEFVLYSRGCTAALLSAGFLARSRSAFGRGHFLLYLQP